MFVFGRQYGVLLIPNVRIVHFFRSASQNGFPQYPLLQFSIYRLTVIRLLGSSMYHCRRLFLMISSMRKLIEVLVLVVVGIDPSVVQSALRCPLTCLLDQPSSLSASLVASSRSVQSLTGGVASLFSRLLWPDVFFSFLLLSSWCVGSVGTLGRLLRAQPI
jgi:hypothetical protein